MALSCKQGSFAKSTGANGTTQNVTVGFQPKAIIFWWTQQTAEGYTDNHNIGIGFSDSTATQAGCRTLSITSADNVSTTDTARYDSDVFCIKYGTSAAATLQESYVSAISSTAFTLTHTTNQAAATIIHYHALGGTDITNTESGTFTTAIATGTQNITTVGFQPDFILMLSKKHTAIANQSQGSFYLGMATGSSNRGCIAMTSEDGQTGVSDTHKKQLTTKALTILTPNTGGQNYEADFIQFTSNGFDLNVTTANDNATLVHFLAIKGGSPFVGNFLQPTSNGVQTYSTTASKIPRGVIMFSMNAVASASMVDNVRVSIGGTDGTSEGMVWSHDPDNVAVPTANACRTVTTKAIGMSTANATGSSSTTDAEADIDSFNSGNFKLNWTTTDATQREVLFIAFSEAAAQAVERALTTETISTSESRTRLAAKLRAIPAQTITAGAGTVAKLKGKIKTLTTETITVGETHSRLGTKLRPIATQTTTLSDSVARVKTVGGGGGAVTMSQVAAKTYANKFITKV